MKFATRMAATRFIFVAILLGSLPGCSDSTDVELHEPGQYLDKSDPLLELTEKPEHGEQLRKRLMMVQTDR